MYTIDGDLPPRDFLRAVVESPFSRVPVWRSEPDNIIGLLHAKDLLRAIEDSSGDLGDIKIDDVVLDAWYVPNTTTLQDQLQAFLKRKSHFALVVDEYGVVLGLVTLEDILEEIVGDISDEHDPVVLGIRQNADGSITVDGSVRSAISTASWAGNYRMRKQRRLRASSFTKPARFRKWGRYSPSTISASRFCARLATASRRCGSHRSVRRPRRKPDR